MSDVSDVDVTDDLDDDLVRTAQQHVTMRVPVTTTTEVVAELLRRMTGHHYDSAAVVAVCEGERLVGVVTIERLLGAPSDAVVRDLMDPDPPTVTPATHQERVAWAAVQHGEAAMAVVDELGVFKGLISSQTLLAVLLEEHDEDMARLGGYLGSASSARSATTERVGRRLLHRLPWLLVGLVGALAAAVIVSAFGQQLEEQVLVAYFVPGVVYIAAAVGMQTETLVIRGLSLGIGIRMIAVREVITGGLLGMILAMLAFPLIWIGWGDVEVAAAVAAAMFAASGIATCVAMLLPSALHRVGKDPAFGSGPVATVIQDLLTVSIYFVTATVIAY
jgi:magnesium transporter